jgi:hypothetical protein
MHVGGTALFTFSFCCLHLTSLFASVSDADQKLLGPLWRPSVAQRGQLQVHTCVILRVDQDHIFIRKYGVHTVFLAGKSPYTRSYTVQIYGSGQP